MHETGVAVPGQSFYRSPRPVGGVCGLLVEGTFQAQMASRVTTWALTETFIFRPIATRPGTQGSAHCMSSLLTRYDHCRVIPLAAGEAGNVVTHKESLPWRGWSSEGSIGVFLNQTKALWLWHVNGLSTSPGFTMHRYSDLPEPPRLSFFTSRSVDKEVA